MHAFTVLPCGVYSFSCCRWSVRTLYTQILGLRPQNLASSSKNVPLIKMVNHFFVDVVNHPENGKMNWDLEQEAIDELVMHSALMELCVCILEQLNRLGAV